MIQYPFSSLFRYLCDGTRTYINLNRYKRENRTIKNTRSTKRSPNSEISRTNKNPYRKRTIYLRCTVVILQQQKKELLRMAKSTSKSRIPHSDLGKTVFHKLSNNVKEKSEKKSSIYDARIIRLFFSVVLFAIFIKIWHFSGELARRLFSNEFDYGFM